MAGRRHRQAASEAGFSLLELLIALTVLAVGITGILRIQTISLGATSFSRRLTEASVLAEDKMEELRTVPIDAIAAGNDVVDARGQPASGSGISFARAWQIAWNGDVATLTVTASWLEGGSETSSVIVTTQRVRP